MTIDKETETIDNHIFEARLQQDAVKYELPEAYRGFYDSRQIEMLSEEDITALPGTDETMHFDDILSQGNAALPKKIKSAAADIEVLKAIEQKNIDAKTFDFDGIKYKAGEAATIAGQLENELKQQEQQLQKLDKKAIHFFLTKAKEKGNEAFIKLQSAYKGYFEIRRKADAYLEMMNKMLGDLGPIYSGQTIPIEQINRMIGDHKALTEPVLKKKMQEWLNIGIYNDDPAGKNKIEKFISSNYEYFSGSSFFDNELAELNQLCNESWVAVNDFLFLKFKTMLEKQLKLI